MTQKDRILTFLSEHPSSTARMVADALGERYTSVASYLTQMFQSRAVRRTTSRPFAYSLSSHPTAHALPSDAHIVLQEGTRLGDEQLVLAALTEGRASDRKTLLDALGWSPRRLGQTLDRLHSAGLFKMVQGSYVLTPRSP